MLSVEKEIGERLRQARESMGLSLDQLQEKTKIQKSFIVAIENGEFNKLPSPFYVRTYLRAYCKCVKIEPHHILRQYRKAEQAERGLTSVHQAITPEMLAQAQQQGFQNQSPTQNMGNIAGTGYMNTYPQTARRTPTNQNSRINMNTALTIAKTNPNNLHNHQVNAGQGSVETGKLHNEPIRPQRSTAESKRKVALDYTQNLSTQHTRLTPSLEQTKVTNRESTRKKLNDPVLREDLQKKNIQSTNPKPLTSTQTYQHLSRAASQKNDYEKTQPSMLKRKSAKSDFSEQKVTKMPKLSRSAARRRSSKHGSSRWTNKKVLIIIASLAICIPLLWATVAALATNEDKKNKNENVMKDKPIENQPVKEEESPISTQDSQSDETPTEEQIVLTSSSPQLNTYEVSGTDKLDLLFRARGESWIQVRKQPTPQKEGYLDEATLQSGHEDRYSHHFSDGKEIWISLGIPDSVDVSVNGKQIKSSKTIHIKQK